MEMIEKYHIVLICHALFTGVGYLVAIFQLNWNWHDQPEGLRRTAVILLIQGFLFYAWSFLVLWGVNAS